MLYPYEKLLQSKMSRKVMWREVEKELVQKGLQESVKCKLIHRILWEQVQSGGGLMEEEN